MITSAKEAISAATPTEEQMKALSDAATNLQNVFNDKPIFTQIQTWDYWKEAIAYLVLSGIGIVGLLINQLILGSISLAMIRHFNPNAQVKNNPQVANTSPAQAQPEAASSNNNPTDVQANSSEATTTATSPTA